MGRFAFTDDLITGYQDIDNHHKTIIELGNRIVGLPPFKINQVVFQDALKYLADYVLYHFTAEEYVMSMTNYPSTEYHILWHQRFKEDIADYRELGMIQGISQDLMLKISFAVEDWLMQHIRVTDRALASFLQQKGSDFDGRLPSVFALKAIHKLPPDFNERYVQALV